MDLVERHIVKDNNQMEELCKKSKLLYNKTLYYLRQSLFGRIEKFSEYELTGLMAEFNDADFRLLPSGVSQQIVKLAFQDFRNYFKALKAYKDYPSKFKRKPKIPKYKKNMAPIYLTYCSFRIKDGRLYFVKNIIAPLITKLTKKDHPKQVHIIPQATCFIIEIVYEKETADLNLDKDNFLSMDLGLSNMVATVNNIGERPFIINGNPMKAMNQWYNKLKANMQAKLPQKRHTSKRINLLTRYRNFWIEDKLHKMSRFVVAYCVEHNIGTIIVGKNKGWKQEINIGSRNNQNFTMLPIAKLLDKIRYKAALVGIRFIETEESYTSKCDSFALEPIRKHESYVGKRVKRGLFQSSIGKLINADINGAINIARKVLGDSPVRDIINSSVGLTSYKINIL